MPTDTDDEHDDELDPEDPDESDMDEHDEPDLLPCPNCRRMINEDAERCHHCGEFVTQEMTSRRLPVIVVVVIAVLIVTALLGWMFGRD